MSRYKIYFYICLLAEMLTLRAGPDAGFKDCLESNKHLLAWLFACIELLVKKLFHVLERHFLKALLAFL